MIRPRSHIGTPEPPADRRRLRGVGVLLAHHVGVDVGARYRSTDPARVLSDARAVAAFGISSRRPWEYSYLIGLDGSIFEQAGEFMAAHVLDFNPHSAAVAFLNANDVQVNAAQIAAWWEVREHMVDVGTLTPGHLAAPHYRYRTTACPGIRAEPPGKAWQSPTGQGRLGNLIPALTIPPTTRPPNPVPVPIPTEDIMRAIYFPGDKIKHLTDINFAAFESGIVRHGSGPDLAAWPHAPRIPIEGVDHFNQLARAANHMSGAGIVLL